MKTTLLTRVLAMVAVVLMLVATLSVPAFADTAINSCGKTVNADGQEVSVDDPICKKLQEKFGEESTILFNKEGPTDVCKYSYSFVVNGTNTTVYLSQKPGSGDVDVGIDSDGNLVVDGISSDDTSSWNQLFARFKGVIVGLTGVGTLVMIVLFIIQFMKLGTSAGNPQARSQALTGVLWTGISAALLGAVTIVVGFFYNAI